MVKWIVVMKTKPSICLDDWGKPRKNLSQVGRHRDLNRDLPNASLVRYHGATSIGAYSLVSAFLQKNKTYKMGIGVCVCVCVCLCTILVPP